MSTIHSIIEKDVGARAPVTPQMHQVGGRLTLADQLQLPLPRQSFCPDREVIKGAALAPLARRLVL
jgi:hypothetical protein